MYLSLDSVGNRAYECELADLQIELDTCPIPRAVSLHELDHTFLFCFAIVRSRPNQMGMASTEAMPRAERAGKTRRRLQGPSATGPHPYPPYQFVCSVATCLD